MRLGYVRQQPLLAYSLVALTEIRQVRVGAVSSATDLIQSFKNQALLWSQHALPALMDLEES